MAERIDREELRMLIREALKEALGREASSSPPARTRDREGGNASPQRPAPSPTPSGTPLRRSEAAPASPRREAKGRPAFAFNSGVLNESKVAEIGRTHAKIVIGTDVAVTPLARDRAREIKVEIVRQKQ